MPGCQPQAGRKVNQPSYFENVLNTVPGRGPTQSSQQGLQQSCSRNGPAAMSSSPRGTGPSAQGTPSQHSYRGNNMDTDQFDPSIMNMFKDKKAPAERTRESSAFANTSDPLSGKKIPTGPKATQSTSTLARGGAGIPLPIPKQTKEAPKTGTGSNVVFGQNMNRPGSTRQASGTARSVYASPSWSGTSFLKQPQGDRMNMKGAPPAPMAPSASPLRAPPSSSPLFRKPQNRSKSLQTLNASSPLSKCQSISDSESMDELTNAPEPMSNLPETIEVDNQWIGMAPLVIPDPNSISARPGMENPPRYQAQKDKAEKARKFNKVYDPDDDVVSDPHYSPSKRLCEVGPHYHAQDELDNDELYITQDEYTKKIGKLPPWMWPDSEQLNHLGRVYECLRKANLSRFRARYGNDFTKLEKLRYFLWSIINAKNKGCLGSLLTRRGQRLLAYVMKQQLPAYDGDLTRYRKLCAECGDLKKVFASRSFNGSCHSNNPVPTQASVEPQNDRVIETYGSNSKRNSSPLEPSSYHCGQSYGSQLATQIPHIAPADTFVKAPSKIPEVPEATPVVPTKVAAGIQAGVSGEVLASNHIDASAQAAVQAPAQISAETLDDKGHFGSAIKHSHKTGVEVTFDSLEAFEIPPKFSTEVPAESDTRAPADAWIGASVKLPEIPVQPPMTVFPVTSIESPVEPSVETPLESSDEVPVKSSVEAPAESSTSTEISVEAPLEISTEDHSQTLVETDAESLCAAPVPAYTETPFNFLYEMPTTAPVKQYYRICGRIYAHCADGQFFLLPPDYEDPEDPTDTQDHISNQAPEVAAETTEKPPVDTSKPTQAEDQFMSDRRRQMESELFEEIFGQSSRAESRASTQYRTTASSLEQDEIVDQGHGVPLEQQQVSAEQPLEESLEISSEEYLTPPEGEDNESVSDENGEPRAEESKKTSSWSSVANKVIGVVIVVGMFWPHPFA